MINNEEFWSVTKSLDDQLILQLLEQFEQNKKAFLNIPLKSYYDIDEYNLFLNIEKWYTALSMFRDDEVLKRFQKIGVDDTFLKW